MWPQVGRVPLAASLLLLSIAGGGSSARGQVLREDFHVTNGPVRTIEHDANPLYIAGEFDQAGPLTGLAVSLDLAIGRPHAGFPRVTGFLLAVVSDGAGGWYLRGAFSDVGGVARSNLAHVRAYGTVSGWNPSPNTAANTLSGSLP